MNLLVPYYTTREYYSSLLLFLLLTEILIRFTLALILLDMEKLSPVSSEIPDLVTAVGNRILIPTYLKIQNVNRHIFSKAGYPVITFYIDNNHFYSVPVKPVKRCSKSLQFYSLSRWVLITNTTKTLQDSLKLPKSAISLSLICKEKADKGGSAEKNENAAELIYC